MRNVLEWLRRKRRDGRPSPRGGLHLEHTPEAIRERLNSLPRPSYLRDFIYGAIDGTVTTFAVVSGVAGASLSTGIVIVLGLANLVGDGFSMAVSNFLGTRTEEQMRRRARRIEELHIQHVPDGEREEVRQIYEAKGLSGEHLETVVDAITADSDRWVDTMLQEEHGLPLHGPSAVRAALTTLAAFVVVGAVPLAPFALALLSPGTVEAPFVWSSICTAIAFFTVGALKSKFVGERWYLAGGETLLMGGVAASLAYLVGYWLKGLVEAG